MPTGELSKFTETSPTLIFSYFSFSSPFSFLIGATTSDVLIPATGA